MVQETSGNPVLIGIVGGMGPHAGVDFHAKVLHETRASADNEHFSIIHMALQHLIADRVHFIFGHTDKNPADGIFEVIRQMDELGVTVAAMPCNTAHAPPIFDVVKARMLEAKIKLRFLHMPEEVVKSLAGSKFKRIGVLGTNGTWRSKTYETALKGSGFEPILPDWEVQERVQDAISHSQFGVKAQSNPVTPEASKLLQQGLDHLKSKGAELVLLACTELPLAYPMSQYQGMVIEDPTRILARALVRCANPQKLKEP